MLEEVAGFNLNSHKEAKTDQRSERAEGEVCVCCLSCCQDFGKQEKGRSVKVTVQSSPGDFLLSVSQEAESDKDGRREGRNEHTA